MSESGELPNVLVTRARGGDAAALGQLLGLYRNYLRLLARSQIGAKLRVHLDASDLVQESLLEAHQDFTQYAGNSEQEFVTWLRQILVRNLADQIRRHSALKRDFQREQSLEAALERASVSVQETLLAAVATPSSEASRREQAVLLADALAGLPADYQEVILLRHVEQLPFEDVGARMGRSAGAVRILWMRALERLGKLLENPYESG